MKQLLTFFLCIVFLAATSESYAVPVTLDPNSLTGLLGAAPTPINTVMVTNMTSGALSVDVYSQAYTDGAGLYAYLYQVENTGGAWSLRAEMFTVAPFAGADASTHIGYLTGTIPSGFIATTPSQEPGPDADVYAPAGPSVSFYYSAGSGDSIDPGEHSVVMYVMSGFSPSQVTGDVEGYVCSYKVVASGNVVGPVPEPATVALLGLGALVLVRRRRQKAETALTET